MLQLAFLVGFSQTDTIAVVVANDTIKQTYKNEVGFDLSPLFVRALNRSELFSVYSKANSLNFFYKRNIALNQYLRVGVSVTDRSIHNSSVNPSYNNIRFTNSSIYQSNYYVSKSREIYGYFGYEKRFSKNYIQPFMSVDVFIGNYKLNKENVNYSLNDSIYPISHSLENYDSTIVYTNGSVSMVKYQNSSSYSSVDIGLLFRAGFMVDLSKHFYLLMQTGGSAGILFGEYNSTYPTYDPTKAIKVSTFNFELLRNNTNLMIGYRF